MPQAEANGLTIEYDTFGDETSPPVLFIMAFGAQMTAWPEEFLQQFADQGHHVIRCVYYTHVTLQTKAKE